jgi:uncharacterized coiled-coil DUF342 family protein
MNPFKIKYFYHLILIIIIYSCSTYNTNEEGCKSLYKNLNSKVSEINETINNIFNELKYELENKLDSNNKLKDISILNEMIDTLNLRIKNSILIIDTIKECDESIQIKKGAIKYLKDSKEISDKISTLVKYFNVGFNERQRDSLYNMSIDIYRLAIETTNKYDLIVKKFSKKYNLEYYFNEFDYIKQNNVINNYEKK